MTDDEAMETTTASAESSGTPPAAPRAPLVRPVQGRVFAGVAAGVARSMGISTGLARVLFVVLSVVGGLGVALYLAGWVLIRAENENEPIAQRLVDNIRTGPSWIGIALLALAALIILDSVTFVSGSLLWATVLLVVGVLLYRGDLTTGTTTPPKPSRGGETDDPAISGDAGEAGAPPPVPSQPYVPPAPAVPPPPPPPPSILGRLTIGIGLLSIGVLAVLDNLTTLVAPQPRHYMALATVVLGAGLIVGGFLGRARWLILIGFFVVPPLLVSPAAEVDWEGRFSRIVSPTELSDLAPTYRAAAGSYEFDLTEVSWEGQTVDLAVEVAAGEIVVIVPEGVGISGRARVSIGEIEAPDGTRSGLGEINRDFDLPGDSGTLNLDLEVGAGAIDIHLQETAGTEEPNPPADAISPDSDSARPTDTER